MTSEIKLPNHFMNNSTLLRRVYYVTSSSKNGSFVVNALTGKPYPFKVGSFESIRLFRIFDSTGFVDSNGFTIPPNSALFPNKDSNILYYDSPEEAIYHKHRISENDIKLWNNKLKVVFPNNTFSKEGYMKWNKLTYNERMNIN